MRAIACSGFKIGNQNIVTSIMRASLWSMCEKSSFKAREPLSICLHQSPFSPGSLARIAHIYAILLSDLRY